MEKEKCRRPRKSPDLTPLSYPKGRSQARKCRHQFPITQVNQGEGTDKRKWADKIQPDLPNLGLGPSVSLSQEDIMSGELGSCPHHGYHFKMPEWPGPPRLHPSPGQALSRQVLQPRRADGDTTSSTVVGIPGLLNAPQPRMGLEAATCTYANTR